MFVACTLVANLLLAFFPAATATSVTRTRAAVGPRAPSDKFVSVNNGQFSVNGSDFKYFGTTAYWLSALNSEQDIYDTLSSMRCEGIRTVRTWGFNDVSQIPSDNSTWFQLLGANGNITVNTGPDGLGKLDAIVSAAEKLGIYLHVSLTNNWNPRSSPGSNETLTTISFPRNKLSNDYGGMDAYIQSLSNESTSTHDEFYTDEKLITAFENYTTQVVSRYLNSTAIFGWEVANDPRCNSTLPASDTCTPQTITKWHARIAKHIRLIDPNHLIASGTHGFFCVDCPKLYPRTSSAPAPGPSARSAPGLIKRAIAPLTKSRLFAERRKAFKVSRDSNTRAVATGPKIRGRWSSPTTKPRQAADFGPSYNGAHGVDSEDILNIPEVSFGTFQLFPDQNTYETEDLGLDSFNRTVKQGVDWIRRQGETGLMYGKPISLTGFGLVTKANAPSFVPFNSSVAPFANQTANSTDTYGVTDEQRREAYGSWVNATTDYGVDGAIHYQWGQSNLTTTGGAAESAIAPDTNSTTQSTNQDQTGVSPNDGYSEQPIGTESSQSFFNQAAQEIGGNATTTT